MSFHDIQFPARLSFGSLGGPERRSDIVALSNGFEERNSPWKHSRRRYDAGIGMRSLDDIEELIAFFEARHGQLYSFRWKDWADYKSCKPSDEVSFEDQILGIGDGSNQDFQLIKVYRSGEAKYDRPISKPVNGTVKAGVQTTEWYEGNGFKVDYETGLLTFDTPPPNGLEVTAGFEFDVPVRFDTDRIQTNISNFQAGEVPSVPIIEVRL